MAERICYMNRRGFIIPISVVAINALAIIMRWGSLSEVIPAHFDLQGNAAGTMARNTLLLYPLIGAAVCFAAYVIARMKPVLQNGLAILASGICLILLSSTMVSLTCGQFPVFMLAEPVILILAVAGFIFSIVKSYKTSKKTISK